MRKLYWLLGLVILFAITGKQADAAALCATPGNVVVNCGFETGSLSGWTVLGDKTGAGVDAFDAHTGSYGAFIAGFGSVSAGNTNYTDLRQTLNTVAGRQYSLSYYTAYQPSAVVTPNNKFYTQLQGVTIPGSIQLNVAREPWTLDGAFLFTATSGKTQLDFLAQDANSFFSLDDIKVTLTPEPASLLLLLAGLAFCARSRRCRTA